MIVLAVGDSHARRFTLGVNSRVTPSFDLRVKGISAASAWGLSKGAGTVNAARKITRNMRFCGPELSHMVFAFGQVDVEAGFVFRRYVRQEPLSFAQFCDMVVPPYVAYCKAYEDRVQPIVKGLNASVLIDQKMTWKYLWGELGLEHMGAEGRAAYRRIKRGLSQYTERALMNIEYNHRLLEECERQGLAYFDINDSLLDDNGLVRDEYLSIHGTDNHIVETVAVGKLHIDALSQVLTVPA